jgi:tetratricopeptide (TPR) repeat protein
MNDLVGRILPFERAKRRVSGSARPDRVFRGRLGFGESLDRWFVDTLAACREEEDRVDALTAELMSRRESERRALIREDSRFHSWILAAQLLEECRKLTFDQPRGGERLARLTLDLLGRLDPKIYSERLIRDLEGRAWAVLGNALRVAADLDGADRAFDRGSRCLADSHDPFEQAEFLALLGTLRRDQRRFDQALQAFEKAQTWYEQIRERDRIPRILAKKGVLWLERAEPARAADLFLEAKRRLPPGHDFRTELAVRHNLCWCYVHLEQYPKACRMFRDNQELYARANDSWTQLRVRWLEGKLAAGIGNEGRAEELLTQVRHGFASAGQDYDAALVSLDLAVLLARQNRFSELRQLAREMAGVFSAHHIHREAILALAFFQQAAERETLTAETVRQLAAYVKKSRFEPGCELKLE